MGSLICLNCKARVDARTREEAEKVIDHAVGLTRNIKCGGDKVRLEWNGGSEPAQTPKPVKSDDEETIVSPKKTKKKSSK